MFYIYRRPKEEETKLNPTLNLTLMLQSPVPVLKYKTGGTTGRLFLKYKSGRTTGRLFLKYKTRGNYWSPVPKVQDLGQSISERNLMDCRNNSCGKIFPAARTIATSFFKIIYQAISKRFRVFKDVFHVRWINIL